ncbi:hypothetical protein [Micromonospora avicenniae]|uniref:hypothetical protein n=1 Tax=Micromonospora avicenniae TaxID=1198245 RepID=UPI0011157F4E|nr:hypothetical protein [Micromonospora avicenniae]
MTADEDRDRLAKQLLELPVHELVDVLRRVLPHYTEDEYGLRTTLVLATANKDEDVSDVPDLALVAWPDRDYYDGGLGPDQGLWEEGHCAKCATDLASNAKRAYCPACGARCALT